MTPPPASEERSELGQFSYCEYTPITGVRRPARRVRHAHWTHVAVFDDRNNVLEGPLLWNTTHILHNSHGRGICRSLLLSTSVASMDNIDVDIVIVGGGPGGLAAAHAITAAAPHLKAGHPAVMLALFLTSADMHTLEKGLRCYSIHCHRITCVRCAVCSFSSSVGLGWPMLLRASLAEAAQQYDTLAAMHQVVAWYQISLTYALTRCACVGLLHAGGCV